MTVALISLFFFSLLCVLASSQQEDESILLSWVNSNNDIHSKVTIAKNAQYRTLIATQNLKKGDPALEIPLSVIYTVQKVYESGPFGADLKALLQENPQTLNEVCILALGLLYEKAKGTSSFLYAYLSTLPKTFSIPLYFTAEDFKLALQLYQDPVFQDLQDRTELVYRQFKLLDDKIFRVHKASFPQEIDFDLFKWAISSVITRAWRVGSSVGIVPFADMVNHDASAPQPTLVDEKFIFLAGRDYQEGEEYAVSYGTLTDWESLTRYGFVAGQNPNNYLEVRFTSPNSTIWEKMLQNLIQVMGYQDMYHIKPDGSWEPDHCLNRIRVANLLPNEYSEITKLTKGEIISLDNELKTLKSLIKLVKGFISKYTSSVQEDQERLKNPYLSTTQKNLILYFAKQKIMLNNALIKLQQSWLALLS